MVVALLVVILEVKLMEAQDQLVTIKWRLIGGTSAKLIEVATKESFVQRKWSI